MTLIVNVTALMIRALFSAAPDRVMSTRPVPDAHRTSDAIAPKYLLMDCTLSVPAFDGGGYRHDCCDCDEGASGFDGNCGTDWYVGVGGSAEDVDFFFEGCSNFCWRILNCCN